MHFSKCIFIIFFFNILKVNSQINITALHIHDIYGNSIEAVKSLASALNSNEKFNIHVDLYQMFPSDCDSLRLTFKHKPLHVIINTIHNIDDGYVIHTEIPIISTVFKNYDKDAKPSNFFKIQHPSELIQDLIFDLIKALQIDNVLIAYNPNTFYLENLKPKLHQLDISNFFLELNQPLTLKAIKFLNFNHVIFIHENPKTLDTLKKTIDDDKNNSWFVISTENIPEKSLNCKILIYPKINQKQISEIEVDANNNLLFQFYSDVAWLAFSAAQKFVEAAVDEELELDCIERGEEAFKFDFKEYLKEENVVFNKVSLKEKPAVYNFAMLIENTLNIENVGVWSNLNGMKISDYHTLKSFGNVEKRHYKILAVIKPPFIYHNPTLSKPFYGFCIDMIEELSKVLNFTYELFPGDSVKDMLGDYANYDIALGGIRKTAKLMVYLDFTEPFYKPVGIGILVKRSFNTGIFKFITVMETTVWFCIIGAYFLNSLMIWAFERFSPFSYRNNKDRYLEEDDNRDFTIRESLWFCIMSITPQGGGNVPKHFSGRMAVITWWIFGFIVLSSYTANLAAFLTLSKLNSDVESFEDLTKQNKLQYSAVNNSDELEFFVNYVNLASKLEGHISTLSSDLTAWDYSLEMFYQKLVPGMKKASYPATLQQGLERVLEPVGEEFALIAEMSDIKYLAMKHCGLEVVGNELSRIPYALGVRRNSYLRGFLNRGIFELLLNHRFENLEKKWWDDNLDKATDCAVPEDHWQGVGVQNIGGVFFIILVGILMACLTIFYEYMRYMYRERNGSNVKVLTEQEQNVAQSENSGNSPETIALDEVERY